MFTDLTLQRHLRRVAAGRPAAAVVGVVADTASGSDPEGTYEPTKRRAFLFSAGKVKNIFPCRSSFKVILPVFFAQDALAARDGGTCSSRTPASGV